MTVSKWSPAVHGSEPFTREELDQWCLEAMREVDRKISNERRTTRDEFMLGWYRGQREMIGRCRLMVRAGTPFLP